MRNVPRNRTSSRRSDPRMGGRTRCGPSAIAVSPPRSSSRSTGLTPVQDRIALEVSTGPPLPRPSDLVKLECSASARASARLQGNKARTVPEDALYPFRREPAAVEDSLTRFLIDDERPRLDLGQDGLIPPSRLASAARLRPAPLRACRISRTWSRAQQSRSILMSASPVSRRRESTCESEVRPSRIRAPATGTKCSSSPSDWRWHDDWRGPRPAVLR
jgi:hypothetical protein